MTSNMHASRFDLSGRRALITGSARGLGWEIAKAMAEAGAHVAINGRDKLALDERVKELTKAELSAEVAVFDATDTQATAAWFADQGMTPDILVNNAGLRHRHGLADCPPEEFADVIDGNLTSAYAMARSWALHLMEADRSGTLINVTSIAGTRARPGDTAYTAGKGGLEAMTRSLAVSLAGNHIRCNAIAPGYFATEANAEWIDDADVKRFIDLRIPMKRWGRPEEIAGAAVFLASDAASYINGHVLVVDAGMTINY